MTEPNDPIETAIRGAVIAVLNRNTDIESAVEAAAAAVTRIRAGGVDEPPSARELIAAYDRAGAGRSAASIVAKKYTKEPRARESLKRRIRRLIRKRIQTDMSVCSARHLLNHDA